MNDQKELLPCPFCGGVCDPHGWFGSEIDGTENGKERHGPECENCGATAYTVEIWNTRATPPAPPDGDRRDAEVPEHYEVQPDGSVLPVDPLEMGLNKFFVNGIAHYSCQSSLLGGDIKKIANVPNYHLFYEAQDKDDIFVEDGAAVRIDGDVKHFFASPVGTIFG